MAAWVMGEGATMGGGEMIRGGERKRGRDGLKPCAAFVESLPWGMAEGVGRKRFCMALQTGREQRRRCWRSSGGFLRMSGSDEWMFTSAKGYDKGRKNTMQTAVLVKVFGQDMFPGEEKWISVSKPSEELLLRETLVKNESMAYVSGANSRDTTGGNVGFLSGSTALLVKVVTVEETRSLVRAIGRLQVVELVHDKPFIVVSAAPKRDAAMTTRSFENLKALQVLLAAMMSVILMLAMSLAVLWCLQQDGEV
eukprot:397977-Hanusia_phi.AAC.1